MSPPDGEKPSPETSGAGTPSVACCPHCADVLWRIGALERRQKWHGDMIVSDAVGIRLNEGRIESLRTELRALREEIAAGERQKLAIAFDTLSSISPQPHLS